MLFNCEQALLHDLYSRSLPLRPNYMLQVSDQGTQILKQCKKSEMITYILIHSLHNIFNIK